MAARPTTLALENLESRLNLSTLTGHLPTAVSGFQSQERALFKNRTKVLSLDTALGSSRKDFSGSTRKNITGALIARPNAAAPAPNVSVVATNKAITVMWVNNSLNNTGFHIERSSDGTLFKLIGTAPAGRTSFVDKTAVSGAIYIYRVTAYNQTDTVATNSAAVALQPPPPPVAPTSLVDAKSTSSSISLTWKDNATTETGYHVYRSTDGTNYSLITTLKANSKAYTDSHLASGTTYYYELAAFNAGGETYASIPFTAATLGTNTTTTPTVTAPAAPSSLQFSNVTGSGVTLAWSDSSTNISGYHVYRSTSGGAFTLVGNVAAGTKFFADTSLTSSTSYTYEVSAWNSAANEFSSAATVSTLAAVPNAPGSLATSNITTSSLTLSWAANSANATANITGYEIYRSTDGTNFTAIVTTGSADTHYSDANLNAGATYWYKVAAVNAGGQAASQPISVTTTANTVNQTPPAPTPAPVAPTHLNFTNVTTSSLTLSWTDTASSQDGIHIYRSSDGVNYSIVGTLSASATSWNDANLASNTTYKYAVSGYNAQGETFSPATAVTTLLAAPNAASNVNYTNITTTSVTINWAAPSTGGQSGFRIYRSTDGANYTIVNTATSSTTSWTDSGLSSGTDYYYKIGAFNGAGETDTGPAHTATLAVAPVTPPPAPATGGVTFAVKNQTSFNELVITGTSGNDSIFVTQSANVLDITANGITTTYSNTFGDVKIYGVNGNDTISVANSVNINTLIYGGDGNDTITNLTSAKATIVTIGNGVNNVTGNGVNTAYWVNTGDTVHATSAETAIGGVNRVSSFFQNVSRNLYGQNLTDPSDSGAEIRLTNSSFFGTGPSMNDINQTGLADCYFLAPLSSLAYSEPQKLTNMAVDLGDGTYAFRFIRSGVTTYVRVDGDLAAGGWTYGLANAMPGANGNQWGSLFEKAYADFRTGADTYSSLNWGNQGQTFSDLGFSSSALAPSANADTTVMSLINSNLSAGHAVVASTNGTIKPGAPLIYSHVYTIIGAFKNSSGTVMIQLRNPWGIDGAGNDGNPDDALVTVDFATFAANFNTLNYVNA